MKNWSIGKKLYAMSSVVVAIIIFVGSANFYGLSKVSGDLTDVADVQLPAVSNMILADMMHDGIRASVFQILLLVQGNSKDKYAEAKKEFEEMTANIQKYLDNIDQLQIRPATKDAIKAVRPSVKTYIEQGTNIVETALSKGYAPALTVMPKFIESFEVLEGDMGKLGDLIQEDAKASREQGASHAKTFSIFGLIFLVAGLLFTVMFSVWIVRGPLKTLTEVFEKLDMESKLIRQAAYEITGASTSLSQSTTQQAAALQETAASIEEINAMVKKSSESAEKSTSVSSKSQETAGEGKHAVANMGVAINEINESNGHILKQIEDSNLQITEIVKVITEIGNKTKVINDIVFQTKLLSFNASVEAARAGEHGKGFAVVAEEVGNLAQMSGNASKEISDMLSGSIHKVESIVTETKTKVQRLVDDARSKVDTGVDIAKRCGEVLEMVVLDIANVNEMVGEISIATKEQSTGIQEITKAMHQLEQGTHSNASTSQKASKLSEDLRSQADELMSCVELIRNLVHSSGSSSTTQFESESFSQSEESKEFPLKKAS